MIEYLVGLVHLLLLLLNYCVKKCLKCLNVLTDLVLSREKINDFSRSLRSQDLGQESTCPLILMSSDDQVMHLNIQGNNCS